MTRTGSSRAAVAPVDRSKKLRTRSKWLRISRVVPSPALLYISKSAEGTRIHRGAADIVHEKQTNAIDIRSRIPIWSILARGAALLAAFHDVALDFRLRKATSATSSTTHYRLALRRLRPALR